MLSSKEEMVETIQAQIGPYVQLGKNHRSAGKLGSIV